jgi:anaerobic selenocysteine-containing dehydrogenase
VLSVPNGNELEAALGKLELSVGIDLYVNETLAHCDYVLPAATMYERDDFPLPFQTLQPTPFRQGTEAVIAPVGQARAEWEVIDEITRRLWRRTPGLTAMAAMRKALALFGVRLSPTASRRCRHPAGRRR